MRALITGGGGFLAHHLFSHLQKYEPGLAVRSVTRQQCDLTADVGEMTTLLRNNSPDVVFHLAGRTNGDKSSFFRDNDLATAQLCQAVRAYRNETRIIIASTTAVYGYGGSAACPVTETCEPHPDGLYAVSKYAAENHAIRHAAAGGSAVVCRITNPVGAGVGANLLCGAVARQILAIERGEQEAVLHLGDLSATRDFLHVKDCAHALMVIARKGKSGQIYNVASGISTDISAVVAQFLDLAGVQPIRLDCGARSIRSPIREQWVSNAKLRELGWQPQLNLHQAISDSLRQAVCD